MSILQFTIQLLYMINVERTFGDYIFSLYSHDTTHKSLQTCCYLLIEDTESLRGKSMRCGLLRDYLRFTQHGRKVRIVNEN